MINAFFSVSGHINNLKERNEEKIKQKE